MPSHQELIDMKPLKFCVNGDARPIHPPSKVLCKECLEELDKKMQALIDLGEKIMKEAPCSCGCKGKADEKD